MAARSGLLTRGQNTREIDVSLLSLARDVVRRLACLRSDVDAEDERILTGLSQFDFLACLVAMTDGGDSGPSGVFYPSFARFYGSRTQPAAQRLLRDPDMRKVIYPDDDEKLAPALRVVDQVARQEAFRFDGWEGYTEDVAQFVAEHSTGDTGL